jgi:hypothetical protein
MRLTLRSCRRRDAWWLLGAVLLLAYSLAIFFDLPTPAGNRYAQNLPPEVVTAWGGSLNPAAPPAPHWWNKVQALRGWSANPEGWFWPKLTPPAWWRWLLPFVLGIIGGVGLYWLERMTATHPRGTLWRSLLMLVLWTFALQLGMLWLKRENVGQLLATRVEDPQFTGYLTSAIHIDNLSAFFSGYGGTLRSPDYCSHCKTHPPGPVLSYWLLLRGIERVPPEWLHVFWQFLRRLEIFPRSNLPLNEDIVALVAANLILLIAAAIVVPLYGLARMLSSPSLTLPMAALGAVIPGLILMSPQCDQVYGTLAACIFCLALYGLRRPGKHGWWGAGAGLLLAGGLYFSLALAVLGLPLAALAGAFILGLPGVGADTAGTLCVRARAKHAIVWLVGLSLGVAIPWALLTILGRFPLLDVLQSASHEHLYGVTAVRAQHPWLFFNLVDYLQFVGLPLVAATLLTLISRPSSHPMARSHALLSIVGTDAGAASRWLSWLRARLNVYGFLFWGTLLILDLSGTTRGEVGRLWIFLTPLALLAVYRADGQGQMSLTKIHILLAAQFIVCLLIGGNWLTP